MQMWDNNKDMENKLITFCIPSYNSEEYLHFSVDSLLECGEDIEVLIINDGSKDRTGEIADEYASKYDFIKAIHQENAGHGGGINNGLKLATGLYFKVLDSDDWVDTETLKAIIQEIKNGSQPDLFVTDFVYRLGRDGNTRRMSFASLFKKNKECTWQTIGKFNFKNSLTLHSVMYKTSIIKESGVVLPEHCSYEDNYLIYCPLRYVKSIKYLELPFYQYLIGRSGQSMEGPTCVRKWRDFIKDGTLAFDYQDIMAIKKQDKKLYKVLWHHLELQMLCMIQFTRVNGSKEAKAALKEFWRHAKEKYPKMYGKIRHRSFAFFIGFPGPIGSFITKIGYKVSLKVVKYS